MVKIGKKEKNGELYKAILQDKKRAGDTLRFVLPETIGKARIWEESVTA